MKVASVAVFVQDKRVFYGNGICRTPCPYSRPHRSTGAEMWEKYPETRPDYERSILLKKETSSC